jgi:DNA-binding MarR family transcriptional regulator
MSRALFGLANAPIFSGRGLGLSDWVAISILSQDQGISNIQLAKRLGVTGQRVNQITTELSKSGLISITVSSQDSRKNELRVTPRGLEELETVNRQLIPLLATTYAGKERALVRTTNNIRLVMKVVNSAKASAGS